MGVIIALLVILISVGLGVSLCLFLYRGRSCQSYRPPGDDAIDGLKMNGCSGTCLPLNRSDFKNDCRVLTWLSSVINTLDSNIVEKNPRVHKVLLNVQKDLTTRRTEHDGDGDDTDDEMNKNPEIVIAGLIEHLNQILTPGNHYEAVQ